MMKQQDTKPLLGEVTIKTEPGTSAPPVIQRLPSLRGPRDLSLSAYSQRNPNSNSAKNKKIYVPNLNVQRNKPVENSVNVKVETQKTTSPIKNDKGKVRQKRSVVQTNQGVFAEGFGGLKSMGRGRVSGEPSNNTLSRPTRKLMENLKIDKKEEEDTMKQLLRDDFIDDPHLEPDFDKCPIFLPLSKEDPGFKKKNDLKTPVKKENSTIMEVINDDVTSSQGYILLQMPNTLPGLPTETQADASSSSTPQPAASHQQTTEKQAEQESCILTTVPGGRIGKLEILKSGRARLVLGDVKWWLEMGTQMFFQEELMDIVLSQETHTGDMYHLGSLGVRMTASPDYESIIASTKPATKPSV